MENDYCETCNWRILMLFLFMSCCLVSPPSGAAQISVRLLGSQFAPQETSVGACGCRPGNWHLPPPVARWSLRTLLCVPAALFPRSLFQEGQPWLQFLFLSEPCPSADFQPWVTFTSSKPPPLGSPLLHALGAASFLFRLDSAATVTPPGSHHFRVATA